MHSTFKLSLFIIAIFIIIIGLFLLIFNFNLIDENILNLILNLWPLILIILGSLLFYDSFRKKRFRKNKNIRKTEYPFNFPNKINEIQYNIKFSYGELWIGPALDKIQLVTVRNDIFPEPDITRDEYSTIPCINIAINKPILPSPVLLTNLWNLFCNLDVKHNFNITIHESDLFLDLKNIPVENLKLKADLGNHKIIIGDKQRKFKGKIYSYSKKLSLIIPHNIFAKIQLLNQFCHINYPQGDFKKDEDGIFIYNANKNKAKTIEIIVDGPVNNLILDIEEM